MIQQAQCGCGPTRTPCGCCAGLEALTPLSLANRPGLSALTYRVGTHATFLETMLARLSTMCLGSDEECRQGQGERPLAKLTTRDSDDFSIALLDGWATVADVLSFYQERIVNEGYLRTATERRSIIELARLVGYRLRPGVAASVLLALTIDNNEKVLVAPFQVRAQSVPGPGELPQTFENIEEIDARGLWNKLTPRAARPQNFSKVAKAVDEGRQANLYVKGITTGLNQGDPLLLVVKQTPLELLRVMEVNADVAANQTQLVVARWATGAIRAVSARVDRDALRAVIAGFKNPGLAKFHLQALSAELEAGKTDAELAEFLTKDTLPALAKINARTNIPKVYRERIGVLRGDLKETVGAAESLAARLSETGSVTEATTDPDARAAAGNGNRPEEELQRKVVDGLTKEASVPPRNQLRLGRDAAAAFVAHSDLGVQALGAFQPAILSSIPIALNNAPVEHPKPPEVYAFRVKTAPFGNNAPLRSAIDEATTRSGDTTTKTTTVNYSEWTANDVHLAEDFFHATAGGTGTEIDLTNIIHLDGSYDKILPNSFVVVDTSAIDPNTTGRLKPLNQPQLIGRAATVAANVSRAAYGVTGKSTRIELEIPSKTRDEVAWMSFNGRETAAAGGNDFQLIRRTVVYAQAELLPLAEEPIEENICTNQQNKGWIVLDGVYSELKSGRWVVVDGERADLLDAQGKRVTGIKGIELGMLAEVLHDYDPENPGDTAHTRIKLAADLEYCYARKQVTIYGNVVKATHGETRQETLGSGDGSKELQRFALKQAPLTYVSAPTTSGVESTLKTFVNDIEWHEAPTIYGLQPTDRSYQTTRNDEEVTSTIFGNGKQGARLPTGLENVRAQYRQGIGKAANVAERKISMLAAGPLHVKEVINPRRASGGANPETRDQARRNTPIAVLALDRLVSISDYADFARTFGGVGKAFSARLSDGVRELVHVTIAGAEDAPIEADSDVLRNLRVALNKFGDPAMPVMVAVRELLLLVISAGVRLKPDYVWEKVAPKIRTKLLETFSFEARDLGQDVFLSEVISSIQAVPGVAYVDVDTFGAVGERNEDGTVRTPNELIEVLQLIAKKPKPEQRVPARLPELGPGTDSIYPAQLTCLAPEVPDTLILKLIE